ncbi:pyruvate decarboxylase [Aspergillus nomiae NRRL 13137]|uniref:Pyruvate decarboxylase n=1 Tax=Aspergillus nomiae NRRL (strain ATCC 15546 / NRRL 13137 / CBS 260.88 / M93) TaxID=1509407 RepID=A0A0L1JH47_ASPN3|nr:pyruvate decarboxylase [Aspergillus nomiae NRRL 13137]KNG91089.1 pyruvate decarboxylase [Aspergillus nomiae NRRL 13137]
MTQSSTSKGTIKVADYLFARLCQLGIQSIFGVPGDYNLRLLDFVEPSGLHWVGTCNELNGAYAADGYARINGLGALITTFGVGELSAINGIAGAYAEKAPVIHIVGTPSRALQDARTLVHHTFADGEYNRFAAMHAQVTVAQANLIDPRTAAEQIDWALQQCLVHSRPVYIQVPDDMVDVMISASNLETKRIELPATPSPKHETSVLTTVLERIYSAKRPMIFVDGESRALNILPQVDELIKTTHWPTWTSAYGKGLVNEQLNNVYGFYGGNYGAEQEKAYFDSADLVLVLGPHYSNTNTQGFATIPKQEVSISFSDTTIQIGKELHRDFSIKQFLTQLLESLDHSRIPKINEAPPKRKGDLSQIKKSDLITQNDFYRFVDRLFREGDIVATETGTASYGGRNFTLPPNTRMFCAVTWLSIGYMLPACFGAALAQQETNNFKPSNGASTGKGRLFLFIGDGSLQMTVQEISSIIREKLDVTIFVINNAGYTIERAIHGRNQAYNDIAPWRHLEALSFFGGSEEDAAKNTFSARTFGELEEVLHSDRIQKGNGLRIVEVHMGREDCQDLLRTLMDNQIAQDAKQ